MTLKMLSKKSLSIILSMAVFVVSLLIPGLAVDETPLEETIQIWDGSIATSYAGGNGSMDSPFIIETGSQLAYMLNSFGGGKYYKLAKDIYLNDVSSDTWYEADNNHTWFIGVKTSSDARYYTFDGKTSNYFNGHLDGDGHSVYGIYYPSNTTSTASGFIPVMTAGSVKNIAIRNSRIVATKNACALSAFAIPTGNITVDRFLSDSDVYLLGAANGATSGIFGYVTGNSKFLTAISNSCSLIPASNCSGGQFFKVTGIVGETWNTYYTITNCYSVMQAIHSNGEATRVSKAANAYVNVYCASAAANDINNKRMTVVTADKMVGAAAGANMWNLGSAFTVTDSYPTLKVLANIPEELWGGFASQPADSDSNGEYEIFTPEEFFWYAKNGGKAKLFNDLWLNDMKVTVTDGNPVLTKASNDDAIDLENNNLIEWYGTDTVYGAIGRVLYTLNGNGHVVNGLYHNHYGTKGGTNYAGLFNAPATNTSIYGLGIENAYMASNSSFSASFILGSTHGIYFTIDSCYAGLNTYHKGYDVGAFTGGGANHATPSVIKNSYVLTTVSGAHGNDYSNAFAGDNWEAAAITYYDSYCKGKAYRSGTNGGNLYTNVDLAAIAGAGAQSVMPKLSGAFIINKDSHPTLKIFGETDEKIWGGFITKPTTGAGTEADPYMIETGEHLAWVVHNNAAGTYYKLANDIYLNDITKINWATAEIASGYQYRNWYDNLYVQGNFEGDGHMVYGIYRNRASSTEWGTDEATALFPRLAAGTTINIHGIGVDYSYICGSKGGSAFIGAGPHTDTERATANIDECFVGENVVIKGYDAGAAVGVNRGLNTTVTNFYSLATLVANSETGIAADTWGPWATVKNAYILGSLDTKANTNATNCYATVAGAGAVVVKQDGMIGDKAALTMPGLGEKFVVTQKYPALLLFTPDAEPGDTIGTSPFIGSGTEEDPYLIITAIDLKNMVGIAGKGAYYKLTNDIYVNDVNAVDWLTGTVNAGYEPEEWFVSHDKDGEGYEGYTSNNAKFTGTIDGNGYAIHGLYYKLGNNSTLAGVIPYSNGVTIKNLGIEDSFIGSGRFTGGFVGYGKAINLSKCYVDDSCAIFGWDAGADYVKSDADIATSGGNGLCSGSIAETIYKEDEAGTYKYDEESGTYVAIAKDEEFTGTRYSVDDIVWNTTVGFMSEALGGLVGRYTATAGTIDNCYVTAIVESHPIYAFGQEGQGVTFKEYGVSGSEMKDHVGGLWGDDWASGTTKLVTATNCFSVIRGHENVTNSTFTNIYTLASDAPAGITKISLAVGDKGLDQMPGLDRNVWYAVKGGTKYPQLRIRGAAIGDVNENGTEAEVLDVTLLRKTLIKAETALNTDTNRDGETNICDLVALTKLEGEKTALEQEAAQKLLDTVYLSTAGSDVYNGSSLDKAVATLGKAITLVKDGGTIVVDGTVVATSVPASAKTVHITGGTLDFSGLSAVNLNTGLIFENGSAIKFADDSNVYANGNTVTINEGVTVQGTPNAIFGGGVKPVYSTNLTVKSGNYKQIYGGGYKSCVLTDTNLLVSGTVNASLPLTAVNSSYIFGGGFQCDVYGNTNVTVSGEVNEPLDHTSHTAIAKLYGGNNTGTVHKNSYVTVLENAEFSYIYGGGAGTCEIVGSTNIDFSGKAMSIYGGSGTVHETNVTVNGGWVHQVFGGLEGGSMTGNTNVTINGGTIDRRVVGGCYNNATPSGFSMKYTSEYYVTGTCTVTLRDEATYNLSASYDDYGITALSRHSTNHDAEVGILVFETNSLKSRLSHKLGIRWLLGTLAPAGDSQIIG